MVTRDRSFLLFTGGYNKVLRDQGCRRRTGIQIKRPRKMRKDKSRLILLTSKWVFFLPRQENFRKENVTV